jgi:hypothetical protein
MTFTAYVHSHLAYLSFVAYAYFAWVLANYVYPNDPMASGFPPKSTFTKRWLLFAAIRGLLAGIFVYFASGHSIYMGIYSTIVSAMFPIARGIVPPRRLAETELIGNLLYVAGLVSLARLIHAPLQFWGIGKFQPSHVSAVILISCIVVYVEIGGTNIVRGLLEKGRVLPELRPVPIEENTSGMESNQIKESSANTVDLDEYNHGRLIGNMERLLLLALVAIQAYQALAFLMTAKGLFRAKDLENRSFSEYFLVGTLVSSVVAVAAGLLIQLIIKLCW